MNLKNASIYLLLISYLLPKVSSAQQFIPLSSAQDAAALGLNEPSNLSNILNSFFNSGLVILGFLTVLMVTYGGIEYMGSNSVFTKDSGKKRIQAAIGGIILALASWIILNTINPQLITGRINRLETALPSETTISIENGVIETSDTAESVGQTPPDHGESTPHGGTEAELRAALSLKNITVRETNTTVAGFQQSTIAGLDQLRSESGSGFHLTGGTESGHEDGQYSHENGYKVDIGLAGSFAQNENVHNHILNTYFNGNTPAHNSNTNATLQNGQNVTFRYETNHWDITFYPQN